METQVEQVQTAITAALQEGAGLLIQYGFSVVGALALLIVGLIAAGLLSRWTRTALLKVDAIDVTLAGFLSKIVRYGVLILVFIMVLSQFGVQTTSLLAALGAAGLAIGLALQGTLANIAAGIMLLVLRPFRVGEYIDADGISGTVQEIGLFMTELKKPDGLFVVAPNSQIWNRSIVNYSRHPVRRFELIVGIDYSDDMNLARNTLLELARSDARVLETPSPVAFVNSLDDSSVGIGLRVWAHTSDYASITWDMTEAVKKRFDDVGLSIPFPQQEVVYKNAPPKPASIEQSN